jgi:hypothetical protein
MFPRIILLSRYSFRGSILLVIFLFLCSFAYSQTRSFTGSYTENFNSLANSGSSNTWTNDSTIDGWQSSRSIYSANDGASNNGSLYSYGSGSSNDRALGSLANSGTGTITYGVCFTNNTGITLNQINVGYTGEQWRVGSTQAVGDSIAFSYKTGVNSITASGTWTAVTALNFTAPTNSPNNNEVNGNLAANRLVIAPIALTGLNIANGANFCMRWQDQDNTGSDYGIAIDNASFTLAPTASSANIRGRILNEFGRGLSRTSVSILNTQSGETFYARTNQFGYFNFVDLTVGDFYIMQTQRKGYTFPEITSLQLFEDLNGLTIIGTPSQ